MDGPFVLQMWRHKTEEPSPCLEIVETWSEASGSGEYTWNSFYVTATVEGTLADSIYFQSRGTLEVAVDSSMSGGFEAAGFSISATVGTTTYFRKTISIDDTWSTGD